MKTANIKDNGAVIPTEVERERNGVEGPEKRNDLFVG